MPVRYSSSFRLSFCAERAAESGRLGAERIEHAGCDAETHASRCANVSGVSGRNN